MNKMPAQETWPLSSWSMAVISKEAVWDAVKGIVLASGALSENPGSASH